MAALQVARSWREGRGRRLPALRVGSQERIPGHHPRALEKAELGRRHWERVLSLYQMMPDDFGYDAIPALGDALIAAIGYRCKGPCGHRLLLQVAVELLSTSHPAEAALESLGEHLHQTHTQARYDRHSVVTGKEPNQVLRELPPILAALEDGVFPGIGQPLPGHRWRSPR